MDKITGNTKLTNERMASESFVKLLYAFVESRSKRGIDFDDTFDVWMGGGKNSWNMTAAQLVRQWDEFVESWD